MFHQPTGCQYNQREDGIYHVIFYDMDRPSIDQYFRYLEVIYPQIPPHPRARLVVDTRPSRGLMPLLAYIVQKSREIEQKAGFRPPVALAIVMEMNIFARVLDKA